MRLTNQCSTTAGGNTDG